MPFTPVHLGPGAALKAIGGRHFSFMVFGGSQVLMDIEPLIALWSGWPRLHGHSHTLAGALVIGTLAGMIGRPISAWVLQRLHIPHFPFTWRAAFVAAYAGTFSHVLVDAVMHADMEPLWPLAEGNALLGLVAIDTLRYGCLALGILGALGVATRLYRHGRA